MTRGQVLVVALLTVAVVISAIGVVYAKHQSRRLFADQESLRLSRDQMAVEWRQLQLELATFAGEGRIETQAREKLGMHLPGWSEIRILDVRSKRRE